MKFLSASLCFLPFLLGSCSPEAYRRDADEEVYSILSETRKEILAREEPTFTVAPPEDPLKKRLLAEIQGGGKPKLELSLRRALEVAAENSREFQAEKERLYLAALSLTGQRNRYSLIFSGSGDAAVSGTGKDDTGRGKGGGSLSVSKILGSGARILGSFISNFFRVFTSGNGWNASSLLSLGITQPLLRGFGREVVLEPLTQAERDTIYAVRSYERFRRTFCVQIVSEYLSVLEQKNNLDNEENNFRSLQRNRERSEELAKEARLPKFQLDQARQQELSSENRLILSRARYQAALDRFKITLGLPVEVDLIPHPSVLEELKILGVATLSLGPEEAISLALENRLDLMNSRGRLEDAERQVRIAADALLIGLDLTAAVEVPEERPEKAGKLNWHRFQWEVGLQLDLPLNQVPERNVYRQSLIGLEAEKRSLEQFIDSLKQGIRNSLRDVEQSRRSYGIQENALALAVERVDSTKLLVDLGRAETRDYLDAQADLLAAQNALTSALVDYVINKLRLLRDLETLEVGPSGLSLELSLLRRWSGEGGKKEPAPPEKTSPPEKKESQK